PSAQSPSRRHFFPSTHFGAAAPPQSTSVSSPFCWLSSAFGDPPAGLSPAPDALSLDAFEGAFAPHATTTTRDPSSHHEIRTTMPPLRNASTRCEARAIAKLAFRRSPEVSARRENESPGRSATTSSPRASLTGRYLREDLAVERVAI